MSDYFTKAGVPAFNAALQSAPLRSTEAAVETAFGKVAGYTGNATKIVRINAGGTAQEATYLHLEVNSQSADYTTVEADATAFIKHPVGDDVPRTFTIDSNANVPYAIGTALVFVNEINTVTIAITDDTLTMAGDGSTGSRTLAADGLAVAFKTGATTWLCTGRGLT